MQSVAELALAVALGTWLGASVVCQYPSHIERLLRRYDACSLIPRWHFFAPRPSMQDFHLVYRDRSASGGVSPWHEVPAATSHPLASPVWNPGRRHNKALFDAVQALLKLSERAGGRERELQLTVPYIALLTYVSGLPRLDEPEMTQFALVASQRQSSTASPTVFFVSGLHALR
jgi:hypothetical protein